MTRPDFLNFIRISTELDQQINELGVVLNPVLHDEWSKELKMIREFVNKNADARLFDLDRLLFGEDDAQG